MKKAAIIFFIFALSFNLSASHKTDSLRRLMSKQNLTDAQRIDLLNELAKAIIHTEPAESEKYGHEALQLSLKISNNIKTGKSYKTIGSCKYMTGDLDSAVWYFTLASELFERESDSLEIYGILNNLGAAYLNRGQYQTAMEHLLKSLEIAEKTLTEKETIHPLSNLAVIHDYQKNYEQAINYYEATAALAEKHNEQVVMRNVSNNLAVIYKELGDYQKSLQFHRKALKSGLTAGNKYGVGSTYNNMGTVYKNLEMYDSARACYMKSLAIKKELNDNKGLASLYMNIGNLHRIERSYDSALRYLNESVRLSIESNAPQHLINAYSNLSEFYEETGDLVLSLEYYKKHTAIKDSLFNEEKSRQISEMQTRYETGKKEAEIALLQTQAELQDEQLKRQRTSKNLIGIGSAFTLLLILTAFQRYRQNQRINLIEASKIRELDRIKSNFFANISHEFRTPLTLISGSLHKLLNDKRAGTNSQALDEYQTMEMNTKRLLQLINQLLDLAKLDERKTQIKAAKGDINLFIKRIVMSFASYAEQKQIGLYFNHAPVNAPSGDMGVEAYFDPEKIEKVFFNLLSNAVKFTPPEGKIDVNVVITDDREFVAISVTNTGKGIPPDKLPHIFDRFYQAEDNIMQGFEGSGIGLALARELVELHYGKISAESKPDEATIFTVKLPLGKNYFAPHEITEDAVNATPLASAPRPVLPDFAVEEDRDPEPMLEEAADETLVLIVEDHTELRKYIRENLPPEYKILEAGNGKAGLEKAIAYLPDLVISDVMMPEMDGFALCKAIKEHEKTDHLPVILLTAKAAEEDKLEGLGYGADDYLLKPFNPDELQFRVRNLIRNRRKLREKYSQEVFLKPSPVAVPSTQKQFLEKVMQAIEKHMEDENFGVEELGQSIGMSRSQTHRKIKALTNQSPSEFIRNFRLERAAQLLKQDAGNIAEIAYMVGFNSPAYFSKTFQEYFKCTPKMYKKKSREKDPD